MAQHAAIEPPGQPLATRVLLAIGRGRGVAAAIVGAYFLVLMAIGGYWRWPELGVPFVKRGPQIPFNDLRHLTSAWECTRDGVAVLPVNPCFPGAGEAAANWPRVWLLPAQLGLDQSATIPLAIALLVAFFVAALAVLPRSAGAGTGVVFGLALCSPAIMFGPFYGNTDIAVFPIVVAAALLLPGGPRRLVAAQLLILGAAMLKLFPIAAAAAVFRRPSRVAVLGGTAVVVAFAVYFLATYDYLSVALRRTSQSSYASYGVRLFAEWIVLGVDTVSPRVAAGVSVKLSPYAWDLGIVAAVAAAVVAARRWFRSQFAPVDAPGGSARSLDLFWVGAAIYVASYAIFRSWDYRLAFALLTIPQLLAWSRRGRPAAIATLVAYFGVLWLDLKPTLLDVDAAVDAALRPWREITATTPFPAPLEPHVFSQVVYFAGLLGALLATAPPIGALRRWLPGRTASG